MANYDPDRAARLLTDAEGIAGSIPGSNYWAMCGIAGEVAATDPDRAERIATSIPDKSAKAAALSDIAVAVAKSDPDRAERIAKSIPDKSGQVLALRRIAQALAGTSSYYDDYERPSELIR
jgi:hypothetical protein